MINLIKTIIKSNRIFLVFGEKISTHLGLNFEKEYKIVSYIKKPKIIDIGAHLGESIKNFKKFTSQYKINSFEPNPELFKIIKKKFQNDKKIIIKNYAISDIRINYLYIPVLYSFPMRLWASYKVNFLRNRWENFTSIKFKNIRIKKIKVSSRKLDEFNFKTNLIKIDTEGSELEVVRSGIKTIKKNLPILIIEFSHKNYKKIKFLLKKLNYESYLFYKSENLLKKINNKDLKKIYSSTTSTNIVFYNHKSRHFKKKSSIKIND